MTISYVADVLAWQPPRQRGGNLILDWLKAAIARRRKAALLRQIDPQLLDDIGLGGAGLDPAAVRLLDLQPHAVAARILANCPAGNF